MELFKPIQFAFRKFKCISFVQRTLAVYKNPHFDREVSTAFHYSLIDFLIGLALSITIVLFVFQIFRSYFEFDIFKIVYIGPLTLLFIENALLLSVFIALFSIIFLKLFNIKTNFDYFLESHEVVFNNLYFYYVYSNSTHR